MTHPYWCIFVWIFFLCVPKRLGFWKQWNKSWGNFCENEALKNQFSAFARVAVCVKFENNTKTIVERRYFALFSTKWKPIPKKPIPKMYLCGRGLWKLLVIYCQLVVLSFLEIKYKQNGVRLNIFWNSEWVLCRVSFHLVHWSIQCQSSQWHLPTIFLAVLSSIANSCYYSWAHVSAVFVSEHAEARLLGQQLIRHREN